jgi:hypothetical protein
MATDDAPAMRAQRAHKLSCSQLRFVVWLCLVQVKSKSREVQLHRDSSLGEAVLECYASGNRNVFSLGFVPVAGDNTVVLLARDTPANSSAVRDLGVDMSQVGLCSLCTLVDGVSWVQASLNLRVAADSNQPQGISYHAFVTFNSSRLIPQDPL